MEPVLDQLNLVVRDMARSLEFYRAIGLTIPDDTVWRTQTGPHHVEVKMPNGFELALDSEALAEVYDGGWQAFKGEGNRSVMSFRLGDANEVDAVYHRVVALGFGSSQPPYYAFWGSRYAIVVDPDGNHVGLMSPPDPAQRAMPPDI
ncbi:MAG: VOC family protein [Gammaproteobacteria bacterium]|nr:VOC family protein [Gammaproteobacteria bacterium]MDE0441703.1 VOC family protein [Gammaproteobacteria bacterium]